MPIYWRAPRKRAFYWLERGQYCIIPYDPRDKCYNVKRIQPLWNILWSYGKKSGKKFRTKKHIAGMMVTRIV